MVTPMSISQSLQARHPQGSMLGPLLFILSIGEMCEQVENRLYAYADDFPILAVIGIPTDRSAVAAS